MGINTPSYMLLSITTWRDYFQFQIGKRKYLRPQLLADVDLPVSVTALYATCLSYIAFHLLHTSETIE